MKRALVGLGLTASMLVIASLSLLHTASETGVFGRQTTRIMESGLTAESLQDTSERVFRAAFAGDAENPDKALLSDAVSSARESFAVDPLAVTAIRSLILGSVAEQDLVKAQAMMETVVGLSKRDTMTLIWLSQRAIETRDLEAVAAYLHMTLSTSARARDAMMRPLINLIQDDTGLNAVSELIKDGPVWEPAFWAEFIRNPVALSNAVEFFQRSNIPLSRLPPKDREVLYANLLAAGLYDEAYALAAADPEVVLDDGAGDNGRVVAKGPRNPFGWALVSKGAYAARIHPSTPRLIIDTGPNASGVVASRIVRVNAPSTLYIRMLTPVPRDVVISFSLACLDEGREIQLTTIRLNEGETEGTAPITDSNCPIGKLALAFNAGNRYDDTPVTIGQLGLHPL